MASLLRSKKFENVVPGTRWKTLRVGVPKKRSMRALYQAFSTGVCCTSMPGARRDSRNAFDLNSLPWSVIRTRGVPKHGQLAVMPGMDASRSSFGDTETRRQSSAALAEGGSKLMRSPIGARLQRSSITVMQDRPMGSVVSSSMTAASTTVWSILPSIVDLVRDRTAGHGTVPVKRQARAAAAIDPPRTG